VRLGVCLGILQGPELKAVNELLVMSQPAHIQILEKRDLKEKKRDLVRARYIRQRLSGPSAN